MAQSKEHQDRILDIDELLTSSEDSFYLLALEGEGRARIQWYSRLLSALALLTEGQELRFVSGAGDHDKGTARVVVITDKLFVFADVDDVYNPSSVALPRAFRRNAIQSLTVTTNASSDDRARAKQVDWPGYLVLQVSYSGIPVTFSGDAFTDKAEQIWTALDDLRGDLAGR